MAHRRDSKIRVLLVDDHAIMRQGLHSIIEDQADMLVVGHGSNGSMGVELARTTQPDVILMDVNMPQMNGLEATKTIKRELPHIRIIGLSSYNDQSIASAMCQAGAEAYVSKSTSIERICAAIRYGTAHEYPKRDHAISYSDSSTMDCTSHQGESSPS
jgi:DNA-binding NarL/FixJ family response regulator